LASLACLGIHGEEVLVGGRLPGQEAVEDLSPADCLLSGTAYFLLTTKAGVREDVIEEFQHICKIKNSFLEAKSVRGVGGEGLLQYIL
jgi:hypothetical protein